MDFLDLKAAIYQVQDKLDLASESYEQAIKYAIEFTSEKDMYVAYEYLNYASFLITIGKIEKATEILEKAYNIITLAEHIEGLNIAEYYFILGGVIYK